MIDDTFDRFTNQARLVLKEAQKIAKESEKPISTTRILLSVAKIEGTLSHDVLKEYSVNPDQIRLILDLDNSINKALKSSQLTQNATTALKFAFNIAMEFKHYNIDVEHILIALLSDSTFGSYKAIKRVGVDPEQIKSQMIRIFDDLSEMDEMIRRQGPAKFVKEDLIQDGSQSHIDGMGEAGEFTQVQMPSVPKTREVPKKALEYFSINLVKRAKEGKIDPVVGRDIEINRCIQILLRKSKNNPVFIGEPGVGKTAIVEGLSLKIAKGDVPQKLLNMSIYQLDLGLMVAGTMYRGQFEERLKKVLGELQEDNKSILFIDELHSIVGTGSAEGSMDAANLLKPALSRGDFRLIGATTLEEYRKHIEKDSALERRLQSIIVREPTVDETIKILKGVKSSYEKHHQVKYTEEALEAAAKLSQKYLNDRFLPDKAIDLIDEAASAKVIASQDSKQRSDASKLSKQLEETKAKKELLISQENFVDAAKVKTEEIKLGEKLSKFSYKKNQQNVTGADIAALVSSITDIPIGEIEHEEMKKYAKLESTIAKSIIGQDDAISEVSRVLKRNRSGVTSQERPIGSFLFLGPSGVGKTELARVLAKTVFGRTTSLIKLDMSEFMERHNAARLTGAPPGYVGYDDAGKLTEQVRKNPYSVVLFDEIEKAHPEVYNLLLQILDEGRLTDSKGRSVNFKNTIIIMTSNIGLKEYNDLAKIGFQIGTNDDEQENLKGRVEKHVSNIFKVEFINRLDKAIFFNPLKSDDLLQITKIKLAELEERLMQNDYNISFSKSAIESISKNKFDKSLGARPLIRLIEREIEGFISDKILKGAIKKSEKYCIEYSGGKYQLLKK